MTLGRFGLRAARGGASMLVLAGALAGCAPGGGLSTRSSRIGADDGTDRCRAQVVALDSTGDFFGEDILTGAAVGALGGGLAGGLIGGDLKGALIGAAAGAAVGAAGGYWSALQQQQSDQAGLTSRVQGDLVRENGQIDRSQAAFDAVMDCRFGSAAAIRADLAAGRIDRPTAELAMARVRQLAGRDLALAQRINKSIAERGSQFDVAADNLGARPEPPPPPPRAVTVRREAALSLRPDSQAPKLAALSAKQPVTAIKRRGDYALVETADGKRGYAPVSDLQGAANLPHEAAPQGQDVASLAGSNAARRDAFSDSVAVSQQAANSGLELAG